MSTYTTQLAPLTPVSPETQDAAIVCLRKIDDLNPDRSEAPGSPLGMGRSIAQMLAVNESGGGNAWIVRGDAEECDASEGLSAAWPLRYLASARRFERPLIYMFCSQSRAGLLSAFDETSGRGLFMNTAESLASGWPKGVRPELALLLAEDPACMPYDPATAEEVRAIVRGALHALYVEGEAAYYYVALHDANSAHDALPLASLDEAYSGMYLWERRTASMAAGTMRLLGAGKALERVVQAAQILQQEWGVASEVWSCPSYTRLAREGARVEQWNTLNPLAPGRTSRLAQCLGGRDGPVIAVTDYAQHVAARIGAYLAAPFVALGAGSLQRDAPTSAEWIVLHALKALAGEGRLPAQSVADALRRYGLAENASPRSAQS